MNKKLSAILLSLTLLMPLAIATEAHESTISTEYSITTQAQPDTVTIKFYVENSGINLNELKEKNDKIVNSAINEIKKSLSQDETIKTITYRVNNIYSYKDKVRIFQKYEVTNGFEVKLKNLDKISAIIKQATDIGIKRIDGLNFSIEKGDDLCNQLMAQAIKEAKSRAQYLAGAAGVSLDKPRSINPYCSLNSTFVQPRYYNSSVKVMADAAAPEPALDVIEPGTINVRANVNMTYYLK